MNKTAQHSYRLLAGVAVFVLAGGAVFYHYAEDLSWIDSFYFCVVTLTTVGYGDITPKTDAGKLFTALYILIGVGIIAAFVNALFKHRAQKYKARHDKNKHD